MDRQMNIRITNLFVPYLVVIAAIASPGCKQQKPGAAALDSLRSVTSWSIQNLKPFSVDEIAAPQPDMRSTGVTVGPLDVQVPAPITDISVSTTFSGDSSKLKFQRVEADAGGRRQIYGSETLQKPHGSTTSNSDAPRQTNLLWILLFDDAVIDLARPVRWVRMKVEPGSDSKKIIVAFSGEDYDVGITSQGLESDVLEISREHVLAIAKAPIIAAGRMSDRDASVMAASAYDRLMVLSAEARYRRYLSYSNAELSTCENIDRIAELTYLAFARGDVAPSRDTMLHFTQRSGMSVYVIPVSDERVNVTRYIINVFDKHGAFKWKGMVTLRGTRWKGNSALQFVSLLTSSFDNAATQQSPGHKTQREQLPG